MRDKIEVTDVVVSTNHVVFLLNRFPRLISLAMFAIFVSGASGITAILKYRSVNPIHLFVVERNIKCLITKLTVDMVYVNIDKFP